MAAVEWNLGAVLRDLEELGREMRPALAKSLNRAGTAVRTRAQRSVREELNLKAGDVNKLITLRRATSRDLQAIIDVAPRPAPLLQFGARETRAGVSVKVKRKGARKVIRHAFIELGAFGARHVFTRSLRGERTLSPRLPIRSLFGISVVQYLDDPKVIANLGDVARSTFEKAIAHEIEFRLAKRRASTA